MQDSTRRQFLRSSGIVSMIGVAGCSQITGEDDIKDTDGDGVIDSEDYAPRDPEIQREDQVEGTSTAPQEQAEDEAQTPTESPSSSVLYRDDFTYDSYQSHWRIRDGHDGSIVSISVEDGQLIHVVDGNTVGGNIVSNQTFDSSGIVRIKAELVRESGGGGFGIHFGEYGSESEVLMGDGSNGLWYTVFPSDDHRGIVVDSRSGPENRAVTYSLTINFDTQTLTEISRDGSSHALNVGLDDVYDDFFSIEIGNGRNHTIAYEYVEIEERSA